MLIVDGNNAIIGGLPASAHDITLVSVLSNVSGAITGKINSGSTNINLVSSSGGSAIPNDQLSTATVTISGTYPV